MVRADKVWAAAGGAVGLLMAGAAAISGLFHQPKPVEPVVVHCSSEAPLAVAGQPLKVLVWNVQYGASTKHHFFYDGGDAVSVPASDVTWTMDAIARVVREVDPDVVLFQEVDRGSDRTGRVDQHRELLKRLDLPCHASTPYHRSAYVPFPGHEHLGKVEMHLSVMSRVRLGRARRHQLPLLDEPWWRRSFNLRRAILEVEVPVDGGPTLILLDTHLSAFSRGDGTLPKQVAMLRSVSDSAVAQGHSVALAGDLNALPPGDDPSRLPVASQALYSDAGDLLQPLYEGLTPVVAPDVYAAQPDRFYTYAPYGLGRTDRMIDHVFVGGGVTAGPLTVRQDCTDISDHQPIIVELTPPPS